MYANLALRESGGRSEMCSHAPLNEIMLQVLVYSGLSSDQIADRYNISVDDVIQLCNAHDL